VAGGEISGLFLRRPKNYVREEEIFNKKEWVVT
jgi:hypothetical protein